MPVSISHEAYIFLCSVAGGALIAFIYDLFRIRRKALRTPALFVYIEDLVFWLLVAVIMFGTVYLSNDGELRGYIFLGAILGAVLYSMLLSRIVIRSSMFIIHLIVRIFTFIWLIISFPFRLVFRIFRRPARFALRHVKSGMRTARNVGRNRMAKAAIWRKVFKNVRKKI